MMAWRERVTQYAAFRQLLSHNYWAEIYGPTYLEAGLMSELDVDYEKDGQNQSRDDSPNDPLVPVHPL